MHKVPFPRLPRTNWRRHGKPRSRPRKFASIGGLSNTVLFIVTMTAALGGMLFYTLPWFFAAATALVVIAIIWLASRPTPRE